MIEIELPEEWKHLKTRAVDVLQSLGVSRGVLVVNFDRIDDCEGYTVDMYDYVEVLIDKKDTLVLAHELIHVAQALNNEPFSEEPAYRLEAQYKEVLDDME